MANERLIETFMRELMREFILLCHGNDFEKLTLLKIGDTVERLYEKYAPTVEAVTVPHNPCGFCGKFEFDSAKAVVGQQGARIVLACASTRYPIEEQFNFCPVCGRSLKEGVEDAAD